MRTEIFLPQDVILTRVDELAGELNERYAGQEVVVVGVLIGAFVFLADLLRRVNFPCVVDFVRLASYGSGTETTGNVVLTKDLEINIAGRDVLVVEDIVDTGITLDFLVKALKSRVPRSISVCVLLDKRARRKVAFDADFVGFSIEDRFVVGYGLDYDGHYRSLPHICILHSP